MLSILAAITNVELWRAHVRARDELDIGWGLEEGQIVFVAVFKEQVEEHFVRFHQDEQGAILREIFAFESTLGCLAQRRRPIRVGLHILHNRLG